MSVKPIQDPSGGMVRFDPIAGSNGIEVNTYESSEPSAPMIYLHLTAPPSFDDPSGRELAARLGVDGIRALRDQCDWFLANHYLVRG
jgi:hypothetical protein